MRADPWRGPRVALLLGRVEKYPGVSALLPCVTLNLRLFGLCRSSQIGQGEELPSTAGLDKCEVVDVAAFDAIADEQDSIGSNERKVLGV